MLKKGIKPRMQFIGRNNIPRPFRARVLIFAIFLSTCATQPVVEIGWFPNEIFYHSNVLSSYLSEYVINIDFSDKNIIRNEYLVILAFINETVIAHYENIENLLIGIPYVRYPSLVDGDLTLVNVKVPKHIIWDVGLQKYVLFPDYDVHDEVISLVMAMSLYNFLINFWYYKTGEILHDHMDHDVMLNKIQDLINSN